MNRRILRPRRFLILIPSILFVISMAALIITLSGDKEAAPLLSSMFMLLISLTVIGNFYRSSIILDDAMIVSQTFFRTSICEFRDVTEIETKVILSPTIHGVSSHPIVILHTVNKKITIPVKFFSAGSLKVLAQWLIEHCEQAEINQATIDMSHGKMPSAFRKKSKAQSLLFLSGRTKQSGGAHSPAAFIFMALPVSCARSPLPHAVRAWS